MIVGAAVGVVGRKLGNSVGVVGTMDGKVVGLVGAKVEKNIQVMTHCWNHTFPLLSVQSEIHIAYGLQQSAFVLQPTPVSVGTQCMDSFFGSLKY